MLTCTARSGHQHLPVALESIDLEICAGLVSNCRPYHSLLPLLARVRLGGLKASSVPFLVSSKRPTLIQAQLVHPTLAVQYGRVSC